MLFMKLSPSSKIKTARLIIIAAIFTAVITYAANYFGTKFAESAVAAARKQNAVTATDNRSAVPSGNDENISLPSGAPEDLVDIDVYICTEVADPENAEYSRCDVRFSDEGIEMFSISRLIPASVLDEQAEEVMKDVAKEQKGTGTFTCISATREIAASAELENISIPHYSDSPAPKGNLRSEIESTNRCLEGYTEHKGVFMNTVPEGYHVYYNGGPLKGIPPYRVIY